MSGYIRKDQLLHDPATGLAVGYIDPSGAEQIGFPAAVSGAGKVATALSSMYDAQRSAETALGQVYLDPAVSLPTADTPTITGSGTSPGSDADPAAKALRLCGTDKGFTVSELSAAEVSMLSKWCGGFNCGLRPFWSTTNFRLSNTLGTANNSTSSGNQGNIQPSPVGGQSPLFGISQIGYGSYLDFTLDGDVFFFRGNMSWSLWVNDRLVNVAPGTGITGTASNTVYTCSVGTGYNKVKFPSVGVRNIRIGVTLVGGPSDLYVRATHAAKPRFMSRRASMLWVSDSFAGTGATQDILGSAGQMAASFGPELNFITAGVGGSGYGQAGSGENFLTRLSLDIGLMQQVSAVALLGGQNDSPAQIAANAPPFFAGLRAKFPAAPIFSALSYAPGSYATAQARQDALIAAAAGVAGTYVIPTFGTSASGGAQWLDGTGRSGATTGDGSADRYVGGTDGSDAVHPTNAGHIMWGRTLAREVAALCKSGAVTY